MMRGNSVVSGASGSLTQRRAMPGCLRTDRYINEYSVPDGSCLASLGEAALTTTASLVECMARGANNTRSNASRAPHILNPQSRRSLSTEFPRGIEQPVSQECGVAAAHVQLELRRILPAFDDCCELREAGSRAALSRKASRMEV